MKAVFETVKTERKARRRRGYLESNQEYSPMQPRIIKEEVLPLCSTTSHKEVVEEIQPKPINTELKESTSEKAVPVNVATQVFMIKKTRVDKPQFTKERTTTVFTETKMAGLEINEEMLLSDCEQQQIIGLFD